MKCPSCATEGTRVVDSRAADQGGSIRRRRRCDACGYRFTTYERAEPNLLVRKRSGRLEPFSAEKLAAGVSAALTDRRVAVGSLERLVSEVEAEVINSGSPIDSHRIGVWVLERLRRLDEVAYLRFASVYKDFQVAGDFEREMAALEKNGH